MLPAHGYPQLKKYKHLKGTLVRHGMIKDVFSKNLQAPYISDNELCYATKGSYSDRFFSYDIAGLEGVEKLKMMILHH